MIFLLEIVPESFNEWKLRDEEKGVVLRIALKTVEVLLVC